MSRTNKNDRIMPQTVGEVEDTLSLLLAGLKKHMPSGAKWTVAGVPFTREALEKKVSERLALYTGPRDAETLFHRLTRERDAEAESTAAFVADMLVTLQNQHGRESEKLEEFGFRARKKPADRSAEEKAAQVARSLQTKEKNGSIRPRSNQARSA